MVFHGVSVCAIKLFGTKRLRQNWNILHFGETPYNVEHHYTTFYTTVFSGHKVPTDARGKGLEGGGIHAESRKKFRSPNEAQRGELRRAFLSGMPESVATPGNFPERNRET
jgi:hypothetical protein